MLRAEGLAAFRGERLVFRDLGFELGAGGALVLTGPNGSGKSTLLRVLAGLVRPIAGTVTWNGGDPRDAVRQIAYVGHLDGLKPGLTAAENLLFAARCGGGSVDAALAALDLAHLRDLPARMLSAGQKRRLALARPLLSDAPLWLLDEPTLGLDTAALDRFGGLLRTHRARGGVVVAATHVPLPLSDAITLGMA